MHFAEIMHILGNKTDLSQTNKAIGGGGFVLDFQKSPEIKALLEKCSDMKEHLSGTQKIGQVRFNDYSDLIEVDEIKQKFLWPKLYLACRIISAVSP